MVTSNKFNNVKKNSNEIMAIIHFIKNNEFPLPEDDVNTITNFLEFGVVVLNKSMETRPRLTLISNGGGQ